MRDNKSFIEKVKETVIVFGALTMITLEVLLTPVIWVGTLIGDTIGTFLTWLSNRK